MELLSAAALRSAVFDTEWMTALMLKAREVCPFRVMMIFPHMFG